MNIRQKTIRFSWKIFWEWLLANLIGSIVGGIFLFFIAFISTGGFGSPSMENPQVSYIKLFMQRLLIGGAFGLILGICQAFVIMAYLKNTSIWILTTTAGFAIGMASEFVFAPSTYLSWALTGILVGIFQWMILRKQVQKSWLWVVINFAIGVIIELLGGWNWGVIVFLFLVAGNIFTGITLAWLITNQKKVEGA